MDVQKATTHVNNLTAALKGLSDDEDFDDFLTIIQKPGFTSKAEATFVMGLLESMNAHAQHLTTLKQVLVSGARDVTVDP